MAAKLIGDVMGAEGKAAKSGLLGAMLDQGVERIRVTDDDGTNLGTVTVAAADASARVTDEAAFTKWVQQRFPSEIVPTVRASFRKKLLDEATAAGDPVDASTGEVIPGVEIVPGEPYLSCRPSAEAAGRMRETLRASGLLALTSGEVAE